MKKIEKISEGGNYTAITVGAMNELCEHRLVLSPEVVMKGKVFTGKALGATGAEMSFQYFAPGQGIPFLHTHKKHEELYLIISGDGEFQVDGSVFPVSEGAIVRVAPNGKRSLRNTGNKPMIMICVQYRAGSFDESDTPNKDGVMLNDKVNW